MWCDKIYSYLNKYVMLHLFENGLMEYEYNLEGNAYVSKKLSIEKAGIKAIPLLEKLYENKY